MQNPHSAINPSVRSTIYFVLWIICATLWVTACFIWPDFQDNPISGALGILSMCAYIVACSIGSFFLLYAIGCNKYICAFALPLIALSGSVLSFYRIGFHTTLTPMLIDVTLHTNTEEALGVITWQLFVWILLNLIVAALLIWIRWNKITVPHKWLHFVCAILLGSIYFSCNGRIQNSLCQRFPYNIPYTFYEYCTIQRDIQKERTIPNYHIKEQPDTLTVVLILGEAARADHLQLNGYNRETNPLLSTRKNIVSFPNIYSEQTHTLASLPYILTRSDSSHSEYQYTETSFVSIFRNANFQTAWISNQDMGSTFTPFISECDTSIYVNAGKSVYVYSRWIDEEMIPILNKLRASAYPRSLYILHSIGSHWYYNNHVPESMFWFTPITNNRLPKANSIEQLNNSYDNTIRYMDYFVDSVIASIEKENAIVIYQADHGEALGEDGEYLHANETEMAKHPACIIWYSDKYAATYPEKIKALIANKDKPYRTDYVFYSILYAAGIEAEGDNKTINIFKQ